MPDFQILYLGLVALFGLMIGSFLNVCIYRIPRDVSVVAPRSLCPECGKPIAWYDNLPLLSYAILRGKCRVCRQAIGLRYPIVELATATLFVATAVQYGWTLAALKWAIFEAVLMALFWTDLEERILPDELTLGGTFAGLILAPLVMVPSVWADLLFPAWRPAWRSIFNAVLGVAVLAIPIWMLGLGYARIRKREGLGFGDVKLLMLLGVFLGLEKGVAAVLAGTVAGLLIGVAYVLVTRKKASTYELPFGSFLCVGAAFVPLVSR